VRTASSSDRVVRSSLRPENHDHRFQTHFCTVFFFHAAAWQRFAFFCFARLIRARAVSDIGFGLFGFFRPRKIPALYSFCRLTGRPESNILSSAKRSRETRAISDDFARSPLLHFFGGSARHNFTRLAGRAP
jgi:hypothetical protein